MPGARRVRDACARERRALAGGAHRRSDRPRRSKTRSRLRWRPRARRRRRRRASAERPRLFRRAARDAEPRSAESRWASRPTRDTRWSLTRDMRSTASTPRTPASRATRVHVCTTGDFSEGVSGDDRLHFSFVVYTVLDISGVSSVVGRLTSTPRFGRAPSSTPRPSSGLPRARAGAEARALRRRHEGPPPRGHARARVPREDGDSLAFARGRRGRRRAREARGRVPSHRHRLRGARAVRVRRGRPRVRVGHGLEKRHGGGRSTGTSRRPEVRAERRGRRDARGPAPGAIRGGGDYRPRPGGRDGGRPRNRRRGGEKRQGGGGDGEQRARGVVGRGGRVQRLRGCSKKARATNDFNRRKRDGRGGGKRRFRHGSARDD